VSIQVDVGTGEITEIYSTKIKWYMQMNEIGFDGRIESGFLIHING
jgi:hypothetical protein